MAETERAAEPVTDLVARLAASRIAYRELLPRIADREPWPLADDFGTGPEASWGPRETLAHMAEMGLFWLGELERVLAGPGDRPVPFGRIADDAVRLGTIERDRTLPLRALGDRLDLGLGAWATRLGELGPDDLTRVGVHPRSGELTVPELADRFVVAHAEDHLRQLESILGDAG